MIQVLSPSQSVADHEIGSVAPLLAPKHTASRIQVVANSRRHPISGLPPIDSHFDVKIVVATTEALWVE